MKGCTGRAPAEAEKALFNVNRQIIRPIGTLPMGLI